MLSVKDYAESRSISQEAVRRQLTRYKDELAGHIIIENRKRLLDDDAVSFLDLHRMPRSIVIEQSDRARQEEINNLQSEIDRLKDELIREKERVIKLQQEAAALLEYKAQNQLLIDQKDRDRDRIQNQEAEIQEIKNQLTETNNELQEAQTELNSFSKTWFGLYKKTQS